MKALRIAAICSSLGLLLGWIWFTQKKAHASMMPGSKSFTGSTVNAQMLQNNPAPLAKP